MELIVWLAICAAVAVGVWAAAPYHQSIIENRDIPVDKPSA